MSRSYSDRLGARFLDDLRERSDAYQPRKSAKDRDELTLAFSHDGFDFDAMRDDWDFVVEDVRASSKALYVDVTVTGGDD